MRTQSSSHKKEIVENNIKNCINIIFKQGLGNTSFKELSVTKVHLNKDKSVAKIYWDTYLVERNDEFLKSLKKVNPKIRTMLANSLDLRFTPRLDFIYDSQYVEEEKITEILNKNK